MEPFSVWTCPGSLLGERTPVVNGQGAGKAHTQAKSKRICDLCLPWQRDGSSKLSLRLLSLFCLAKKTTKNQKKKSKTTNTVPPITLEMFCFTFIWIWGSAFYLTSMFLATEFIVLQSHFKQKELDVNLPLFDLTLRTHERVYKCYDAPHFGVKNLVCLINKPTSFCGGNK